MVKMHSKTLRPAIAMIELIFAIVIMGIVMMSAPMLISTATKSTYVSLLQEGINEAASRVNMIMGYSWDEGNTDGRYTSPILHTTSATSDLDMVATTGRRKGTPGDGKRTFMFPDMNNSNINASAIGIDASEGIGTEDDIDDFVGTSLIEIESASIDYTEKTTVDIGTVISYVNDDSDGGGYNTSSTITYTPFGSAGSTTSSVKSIVITLTSTDTANADVLEKTIILRAFSCNIGGYEFEERVF